MGDEHAHAPLAARAHMKANTALEPLHRAVGTWDVTGSHPLLPGRKPEGRVTFELIEDGAFLRMHSKMEDAELPEGVAIFGTDGDAENACTMLYFDERGVARRYEVTFHADGFEWARDSAKLSQRFRAPSPPTPTAWRATAR